MLNNYYLYLLFVLSLAACQEGGPPEGPPIDAHQEDWAVFLREDTTGPSVITIDLGWRGVAPLQYHNKLMVVSVLAEGALPSGFPEEKEVVIANQLQDQLIRALEQPGQGIFVGSSTSFGLKALFFYLNDSRDSERIAGQVLAGFNSRKAEQEIQKDLRWAVYFNLLMPTSREMNEIRNEKVLRQLQEAGDRLRQPRPIDHWSQFTTLAQRDSFLKDVQAEGFELVEIDTQAEGNADSYVLHIIRQDSIHIPYIHELTWRLRQKVEKYGGAYDGWETIVVRQ